MQGDAQWDILHCPHSAEFPQKLRNLALGFSTELNISNNVLTFTFPRNVMCIIIRNYFNIELKHFPSLLKTWHHFLFCAVLFHKLNTRQSGPFLPTCPLLSKNKNCTTQWDTVQNRTFSTDLQTVLQRIFYPKIPVIIIFFFWIPEKTPVVLDLLACHLLGECFLALGWELLQHSEKNKGRINLCHCMVGIKPPQKNPKPDQSAESNSLDMSLCHCFIWR